MKKIILLFVFAICARLSYGQIKVVSNGDILVSNTTLSNTTADLDIPLNHSDRNNFQAGSFGIQSFADNNGFLTHNSYFDLSQGGTKVVMRKTGKGAIAQFFNGRIIYRTVPQGAAGTPVAFTEAFTVQNNGNMQIGYSFGATFPEKLAVQGSVSANGVILTSDKKSKKNVKDFDKGLDAVMALNPISYRYNGKAGTVDDMPHVGIFAQELQKVAPELVSTFEHTDMSGVNPMTGEGLENATKSEFLRIDDTAVKYMLINAIQEQQELIEVQAEKIASLEEAFSTIGSGSDINNRTQVTLNSYDLAELSQNTPNPFNGFTNIAYIVPSDASSAQISIFGKSGQLMKTLDIQHIGQGTLEVNAEDLPAGTYSYQLIVDGKAVKTSKMVLAR